MYYYNTLFSSARRGSHFLFIDNRNRDFYGWFDDLAKTNGLTIIEANECTHKMDPSEEKQDLGEYYGKFSAPKIQADIAYRVAIKD